jgi:hypothetical protein
LPGSHVDVWIGKARRSADISISPSDRGHAYLPGSGFPVRDRDLAKSALAVDGVEGLRKPALAHPSVVA